MRLAASSVLLAALVMAAGAYPTSPAAAGDYGYARSHVSYHSSCCYRKVVRKVVSYQRVYRPHHRHYHKQAYGYGGHHGYDKPYRYGGYHGYRPHVVHHGDYYPRYRYRAYAPVRYRYRDPYVRPYGGYRSHGYGVYGGFYVD